MKFNNLVLSIDFYSDELIGQGLFMDSFDYSGKKSILNRDIIVKEDFSMNLENILDIEIEQSLVLSPTFLFQLKIFYLTD